ncbi:O-antigen ligase family protein [Vibrio sp. C8]
MKNMLIGSICQRIILVFFFVSLIWLCFNIFIPRDQVIYTYDIKRFFSLFTVAIFFIVVILSSSIREYICNSVNSLPYPIKICSLIFIITLFVVDLFNSSYVFYSYLYDLYFIGIVGLIFFFLNEFQKSKSIYFVMACLITFCLFASVSVAFYLRVTQGLYVNYHTILSFVNPRFLNQVQIWFVLPILYLSVRAKIRKNSSIFYNIALSLTLSLIVTLDARGLFLAVAGGIVLITILNKSNRVLWIKTILINMFSGIVISIVFFKLIPFLYSGQGEVIPEIRTSSSGRIELWTNSITNSSLAGNGGGSFVCGGYKFGHPHNSLLTVIYEWGVIPALAYISLCLILLKHVFSTKAQLGQVLGVNVLIGVAYSLVSGVFIMPLSQLMAVMSLAAFWSTRKHLRAEDSKIRLRYHLLIIFISSCFIFSCIYLALLRLPFYEGLDQNEVLQRKNVGVNMWVGDNCLRNSQVDMNNNLFKKFE